MKYSGVCVLFNTNNAVTAELHIVILLGDRRTFLPYDEKRVFTYARFKIQRFEENKGDIISFL